MKVLSCDKWQTRSRVPIFPPAFERTGKTQGNQGGSMFDRAGRGLHTPPRPLALSVCVEAHCSARARLLYGSSEECPTAFLPATENWALPYETALSITSKDYWTTHIKRTVFQSWKIFFFSGARKTSLLSVRPLLAVSMECAFLSPKIFRIALFSSVWCVGFFFLFLWMQWFCGVFVVFFISLNLFFFSCSTGGCGPQLQPC